MMAPIFILGLLLLSHGSAKVIHVSPGEFLQDAVHAIQSQGLNEDTEVRLAPGMHLLSSPLVLAPMDGPWQLRFKGDDATISGGIPVVGQWNVSSRCKGCWECVLPSGYNHTHIGTRMQMWRGQQRLTLARSPVKQYIHATGSNITFHHGDISPDYYDFENVHLVLYESWTASYHGLARVNATSSTAYLATAFNAQWANSASGSRFYVENALEEIDESDEFYVDSKSGVVILMSTEDPNQATEPYVLAGPGELVRLEGMPGSPVQGIRFEGIEFAHTSVESEHVVSGASGQSGDFLTEAMIHLKYAESIHFSNCTFRATGGYGYWAEEGAYDTEVADSVFTDLGAGAIRLGRGHAVDATGRSESERHNMHDNLLHDGGHIWQEGCGVLAQNVGNVNISHNEIAEFRYTGVSTGWTWGYGPSVVHDVITSYNHIHDIGMGYLSDMGCVYTLGHQPGSQITNNYCHDVQSFNYGGWGYYTDEGSRDELFENNIATRTKCSGHHQHYGTDNLIRNNIYYHVNIGDVPTPGRKQILMPDHCDSSVRASTHGRNVSTCHPDTHPYAGCCCHPGCDQGKCSSWTFERNIIYQPKGANSTFVGTTFAQGLENFTFNHNVYFADGASPSSKMFNTIGANTHTVTSGENFQAWQEHNKDVDSLVTDPQFVPSSSNPFMLSNHSPAILKTGFVPIDISSVGPRNSPHRSTMRGTAAIHISELLTLGLVTN